MIDPVVIGGPTIGGVYVLPASGVMSWNAQSPAACQRQPDRRRRERDEGLRPLHGRPPG